MRTSLALALTLAITAACGGSDGSSVNGGADASMMTDEPDGSITSGPDGATTGGADGAPKGDAGPKPDAAPGAPDAAPGAPDAAPGTPDAAPAADAKPKPDAGAPGPDAGPIVDPPFTGANGTILFVTQVPQAGFTTVTSVFGNHLPSLEAAPRGGALMLRYADGTLRNLTLEAGYGGDGMQGPKSIAVREPAVHWSGNKAIFAMVVGAPTKRYEVETYHWQLYEVTGLSRNDTAVITKVPNQPSGFNNVSPTYAPDDAILFSTDRPRGGESHLYPQLDEYESAPTNSGLWRLDPQSGDLSILTHAPSGVFSPFVDSFGRVLFTKWDHLQRDQQADADRDGDTFGSFTYADESAGAAKSSNLDGVEVFPEPRDANDPSRLPNTNLHTFNQFMPWMINVDGTGEETLNHLGRHELGGMYSEGSFTDDPNLTYLVPQADHLNRFYIRGDGGYLQMREDPKTAGRYYATYSGEFGSAASGLLLRLDAPPGANPEDIVVTPLTHPNTREIAGDLAGSTGHYRDPLPLSDGNLIASHTAVTGEAENSGSTAAPQFDYAFRLKVMVPDGSYLKAGAPLTAGIHATIQMWNPDVLVSFDGDLWELDAVEVRPRPRPTPTQEAIESPEQNIFTAESIDVAKLRDWLRTNDLALVVSRNVTYRDRADQYQPYNLRVAGAGGAMTAPKAGKIYDISHLQFFQGDALRGYGGANDPNPGRRLLARPMHGANLSSAAGGPSGAVALGADGSMAAIVPARRALTWQLTAPDGAAVVRERNWVTFAPGEIRVCAVCHGLNKMNQAGALVPTNPPEALRTLVKQWKANNP